MFAVDHKQCNLKEYPNKSYLFLFLLDWVEADFLLAPTGALIVMMCYYIYIRRPLFLQIFTQSIVGIDVIRIILSPLNNIIAIAVTRC